MSALQVARWAFLAGLIMLLIGTGMVVSPGWALVAAGIVTIGFACLLVGDSD